MKDKATLSITSLLSIVLRAFHWVDDIVRGISPGGVSGLGGVLILVVWLYGTLVLAEPRSGYVIILLGSLLGLLVPVIHMKGRESAERSPSPAGPSSLSGHSSRSA